jgi:hypothetical protein
MPDFSKENIRKKIISFALWGDNKLYYYGAIENALIAQKLFPDWICRFYIGQGVPDFAINYLKSLANVQIIFRNEPHNLSHMFWRFEPMFEDDVRVMISRDCDSRLSEKEQIIIKEWRNSDKDFHIIRDSPGHKQCIMGGLFGARKGICLPLKKEFIKFPRENKYSQDQKFLRNIIYPFIKNKAFIHDAGFHPERFNDENKHPMPKGYENIIIGDRITETPIASKIFNDEQTKFNRYRNQ